MTFASDARCKTVDFDVSYRVVGWSMARLALDEVAALRKTPEKLSLPHVPSLSLKHGDEQTVAALAAIFRAIGAFGLGETDFGAWSVVAASRFLGRAATAQTFERYKIDGAWGVSMQLVPHHTLHAVAATASLAIGSHGAAIGCGGGAGNEAEGALAALTLLRRSAGGGLWLLWTGWEPELVVDSQQRLLSDSRCVALALAIQGEWQSRDESRFRVRGAGEPAADASAAGASDSPRITSLVEQSLRQEATSLDLTWDLGGGLRLEFALRPPVLSRGVPTPQAAKFDGLPSPASSWTTAKS